MKPTPLKVAHVLVAALAVAGLAWFWKVVQDRAWGFEIVETKAGEGAFALAGRVLLPKGLEGDALGLEAVDEAGQRFLVHASPSGPEEWRFRIPAGFPRVEGDVELRLLVNGRVRSSQPLRGLQPHRESFEARAVPSLRAFVEGGAIIVEREFEKRPGDVYYFLARRTENQLFDRYELVQMTAHGPSTLRATIEGPYVAEARQVEVDIVTDPYEHDEFSFDGAALVKRGQGFALSIAKAVEVRSRQGRTVRVPVQTETVNTNRTISLRVELLEEWPAWSREPARVALPDFEPLGISMVFVVARWTTQPAGGGGSPVTLTPPEELPAVRVGPIGRMRVLLPPKEPKVPRVERFAIPVEGGR